MLAARTMVYTAHSQAAPAGAARGKNALPRAAHVHAGKVLRNYFALPKVTSLRFAEAAAQTSSLTVLAVMRSNQPVL